MKRGILILVFSLILTGSLMAQFEDRFGELSEKNIKDYAGPFATSLGTAMNSGGYYTASIPAFWGFSFSIKGMLIIIPEDQKTFAPTLPNGYTADVPAATIYGDKGGYYAGPDGYITTPPGINKSAIPAGVPQISASFMGTEVLLRYLPEIDLQTDEGNKVSMFGIGVAHSISQYIPLIPIDAAAQLMYNKFEISNLFNVKNIAFNVHASKTLGIFTPYVGLQYENTTVDVSYTIKGEPNSGDPELRQDKKITTTIDGENHFRATIGASLQLAVIVLNADYSLSTQPILTTGLTLAF